MVLAKSAYRNQKGTCVLLEDGGKQLQRGGDGGLHLLDKLTPPLGAHRRPIAAGLLPHQIRHPTSGSHFRSWQNSLLTSTCMLISTAAELQSRSLQRLLFVAICLQSLDPPWSSGANSFMMACYAMVHSISDCMHLRQDGEKLEQAGQRGRLGVAAQALHEPLQAAARAPLLRRHVRHKRSHRQAQLRAHRRRPIAKSQQQLHQRVAQAGCCALWQLLKVALHLHTLQTLS